MISNGSQTIQSYKATFAAAVINYSPATSPTTVLSISGLFAGKVLKVLRIGISASQTTGGIVNLQLAKLSSALTGGTTSSPLIAKYDSRSVASGAGTAIKNYTVNTTGGGIVNGLIRNIKFTVPTAAPTGARQNEYIFDFVTNYSEGLTLRGASEILALSFLGATISGLAVSMWIEWTEE